ncbi:cell division ATPase FtsA [Entomoplasma freundtii]|uniref:Cell division protein FtsA n=1 Tax=Entomoplasma freundtii TaxID=74700 RepID=A0A2K8NRP2_9MOLU|nr:hypothetical protein [Entomoplasma freundtii]ATZ16515.1 cell division protein FtsA [Entomoplasma freundtii]TDY56045.1 cell division ATPase FtsA [Entomoplasma freundtii]
MATTKARLYGTLELTKNWFLFSVFKTTNIGPHRLIPLFKRELKSTISTPWIDENDQVKNLNGTALKLAEVVQEFHQAFPQYKLVKIALILPTTFLQIRKVEKEIQIGENHQPGVITETTFNKLTNWSDDKSNENLTIIDNKIIHYWIDKQQCDRDQLLGMKGQILTIDSLIYELPKQIVISFQRLLNLANLECLWMTTSLQSLHRNFEQKGAPSETLILTNWKEENLEMGFFENGWLKKVIIVPQGFDYIEKNLEQQLGLPKPILSRYLFKLIDYKSNNIDNQINICGIWDHRQKILKKYSLKNIQEIIGREFQKLYLFGLKQLFAHTILPTSLVTYHFGLITKMAGMERLMSIINHLPHYNFRTMILGWGLNTHFHTAAGLVSTLEKINNYALHPKVYTSQGSYLKPPTGDIETKITQEEVLVNNDKYLHNTHKKANPKQATKSRYFGRLEQDQTISDLAYIKA